METIPLILTGIQTGMSVLGSMQEAKYAKQVAKNNEMIAEENRRRGLAEASVEAQEQDFAARENIGLLVAEIGASGFKIGAGSTALAQKGAQELAAKDRGYTYYKGQIAGRGFDIEKLNARSDKKAAVTKGRFGVASSLVSGASKAFPQAKAAGLIG